MNIGAVIFWLFHPNLLIRKQTIAWRKNKAIKKALRLSNQSSKNIYVVQVGWHFEVGTREELHRFNKNGRKNLCRITKASLLDFNCKHSIIFTANNGKQQMG